MLSLSQALDNPRVGILSSIGGMRANQEVIDVCNSIPYERLSNNIELLDLDIDDVYDTWMVLSLPRLADMVSGFKGFCERTDLRPANQELIQYGRDVSAHDIVLANGAVEQLNQELTAVLDRFDILISTAVPFPPFKIGKFYADGNVIGGEAYRSMGFTAPFNLAQLPAVALPAGFTPAGLPVGI